MTEKADTRPRAARGPYRNSAETRARLIDAALVLFGTNGFEATSTRDIARKTGVGLPAITYHFGSKEGLYRACAEHVVERYRAQMQAGVEAIQADMPRDREAARAALRHVVAMLATMLLDTADDDGWMTFMMREMNGAGLAHDLMYRDLWEPGLALVAALVAAVQARAAPVDEDKLEALLLLSSFSAFSTARQVSLDFGGWPRVDSALVAAIVARLEARIDAL
ncbi:HTH-type transcriptional repressor ComR [Sphingomonas jeddahensis]|uniref:HTH-type transcriptional repressor ComR n=1 Tax=Sphingomonas jeddahensis TaxID=1915074 RepID=A0A1V2ESY3_9SPHN|nr:HTH-type transcriptional repressor ComR [Sphingomonas jeddahensis]